MINDFAEATDDHQWIHVDVERAARELPRAKTIAHGYLPLSLVPRLLNEILVFINLSRSINYGSERVRLQELTGPRIPRISRGDVSRCCET
jgi:acyl dehydratase